jgi:hypothetical protein
MTAPKVSIIILNWNGLEDTTECPAIQLPTLLLEKDDLLP